MCDDFSTCTTEFCDPVDGCVYVYADCDDNNSYTWDYCDEIAGCIHEEFSYVPPDEGY